MKLPADRAQRVDKINGVICLVVMFTCGVIVIKKSKMAHFVFSDDDSKKLIIVWPEYLNAPERCY